MKTAASILAVLSFLVVIAGFIGLFKPTLVLPRGVRPKRRNVALIYALLWFVLLLLFGSINSRLGRTPQRISEKKADAQGPAIAAEPSARRPAGRQQSQQQGVFANVDLMRDAIYPILPKADWTRVNPEVTDFSGLCETNFPPPSSATAADPFFVASSISYFLEGKTQLSIEKASIQVTIFSPGHLNDGKARMEAVANKWFQSIGKATPPGLIDAISQAREFRSVGDGIATHYVITRGRDVIKRPGGKTYAATFMTLSFEPQ
uniref:Uncharacterized protein n=1 Tax=Solibacter usitatus (strain Ellin6076) TaxID=234267 RepID=Q01TQ1_SOLUE